MKEEDKEKNILTSCECGSTSFLSISKNIDYYELIDGKMHFKSSDSCDNDTPFYFICDECREDFEQGNDLEVV